MDSMTDTAPELRVARWIDADGEELQDPVRLSDLGAGHKIIFCFQDWCPGCHSQGFPAFKALHDALVGKGVGFAAIQTVFEGAHVNTFDKLRRNQEKYDLPIPFGHDTPPAHERFPTYMQDYDTHGTPWFTVISAAGAILYSGFTVPGAFIRAAESGASLLPTISSELE